jgi:dipeptidyl aminopeptidase/acylaminoacyl peptidase
MKTSRITLSVLAASVVMAAGVAFPTGARAQSGGDAFSSQGGGIRAQAIQDAFSTVSVAPDGTTPGNGHSADAAISGDGRLVAFASRASNLVASDTNDSSDIFVRDRQTNTTTRVSVTTAGEERQGDSVLPRITPDGRFVVFQSSAALVADDTCAQAAELCRDIYLHDRNTSTTTRMSITALGSPANGPSYNASVSADGQYIVFLSEANNLVPVDSNQQTDVFMRDRQLGVTTRVSVNATGQTPYSHSDPRLSADGRSVLYTQYRAVTPCTTVNCGVLVLRDLQAGTFTDLINLVPPPSGDVVYASVVNGISDDGRIVVIRKKGPAQPGNPFIYERDVILDRQTGRVRDTPTGGAIPAYTQPSALSGDGRLASYGVAGFHDRITDQREGLPLYVLSLGRPGRCHSRRTAASPPSALPMRRRSIRSGSTIATPTTTGCRGCGSPSTSSIRSMPRTRRSTPTATG